jgi:hypothetical protein
MACVFVLLFFILERRMFMIVIYLLAIGLVVSTLLAFANGVRRFGMGGLVFIILASGVIWAAHIPLA